mgnify:CR=1 FL=1
MLKKEIKLSLATNISKSDKEDVKNILNKYGIPFELKDNARDIYKNDLENCLALYLPQESKHFNIYELINKETERGLN